MSTNIRQSSFVATPAVPRRVTRAFACVVAALVTIAAGGVAQAQCGPTWSTFIGSPGANASVSSFATLPSGDLIVGGNFTSIGGIAANRVARYNPANGAWSALGTGLNNFVTAVAVVPPGLTGAGDVIVAGAFTAAGPITTNWVARYNPTTNVWSALGTGLAGNGNNSSRADSLAIVPSGAPGAGEVIVGGFFITAGGVSANNIARFNLSTSSWSALGVGVSGRAGAVCALPGGVTGAGDIFATSGGASSGIVSRFNRAAGTWSTITTAGANTIVNALTVLGGNVVATGAFSSIGPTSASGIARYSPSAGTWSALGTGLSSSGTGLGVDPNGDLLVTGIFASAGGAANTAGIARFNPTTSTWSAVGTGAGPSSGSAIIALNSGDVIVGGGFAVSSPYTANNIARYTTSTGVTITTQPVAQTICPGGTVSFTVAANSSVTPSYRWQLNNVDIDPAVNPSATTATLTVTNAQSANAGSYRCIVSGLCSATSNGVALTLRSPPLFSIQPASSQSLCVGGSYTVQCFMNPSAGPYTYFWRKGTTLISTAANPSSATNQLQLNNFQLADAGSYTCEITNSCGTVVSNPCVISWGGVPTVTQQPQSAAVCIFSPVSLSIAASSNTVLYRWYKNGAEINTTTNPSAATPTLTFASFQAGDVGNYSCFVQAQCGADFSATASLTLATPIIITTQPTSRTVCAGSPASFTVAASSTLAPSYQWRRGNTNLVNGPNITGATSPTLTILSPNQADAAVDYNCVVINACSVGTTATSNVSLIVNTATNITQNPLPSSACIGQSATFTVAANGTGTLIYQWRRNAVNINTATNPSAATPTLSLANITANAAANYDCVITSNCGPATSTPATLTITSCSCTLADVASDSADTTLNPNNSVGPEDLEAFVNGFIAENPAIADVASDSSDTTYTPNGSVGPEDLEAFVNSYLTGC